MDTETKSEDLDKLKQFVKAEYSKINALSISQKQLEKQTILHENRRKLDCLFSKRFKIDSPLYTNLEFYDERKKGYSPLPIQNNEKNNGKNVANETDGFLPARVLPPVKRLPIMQSWVSLQQNYFAEDEKVLSNIPYFDDNLEETFVEDLKQAYDCGIHGIKKSDFLNDEMFFELVEKVAKHLNNNVDLSDESEMPPHEAFVAISEIFPDKGTITELKSKFRDLLEKRKGISLTTSDQCNPNIDGPGAISASAEQTLHSFSHLFCRRCYKYDCYLHPPTSSPKKFRRKPSDMKPDGNPCSQSCYRLIKDPKSEVASSSSVTSPSNDNQNKAKTKRVDRYCNKTKSFESYVSSQLLVDELDKKPLTTWSPAEESLFRVYANVLGDNYCAIANIMVNKTCKQVFDFARQDLLHMPSASFDSANEIKLKKFRHKDWHKNYTKVAMLKEADGQEQAKVLFSYTPCVHDKLNENCLEQPCGCIERKTYCEKFCNCSPDCPNRFPGCKCRGRCDTKACQCYLAVRECDPDLCLNCGASDFSGCEIGCQNVNIQRGLKKMFQHLLVAESDIAGWGCFLRDPVEKNTFISEYCGELISQEEAERRGKVYDRVQCSFLFNLNDDQVVDATRKGNTIRFANHSVNPNCVAKVMMVNGDHRIGIFAKTAIGAGEELFFDYRYGPKEQLRFVGKERDRSCAT